MSVRGKFLEAALTEDYDEVVRFVDKEGVEVNSEAAVSFPLKKKEISIIFFFLHLILYTNSLEKQLLYTLVKMVISKWLSFCF